MKRSRSMVIVAALVVVAATTSLWWHAICEDPGPGTASPAMPDPNARDTCLAAAKAVVKSPAVDSYGFLATPAERQAAAAANRRAHELLRQGFAYDYREPAGHGGSEVSAPLRTLARALACIARAHVDRGEWAAATDTGLDCLRLGADVPHGGDVIGMLVGASIASIGRRSLQGTVEHLSAPEARHAARRLEAIMARQPTFQQVLEDDQRTTIAALRENMQGRPGFRAEFAHNWLPGPALFPRAQRPGRWETARQTIGLYMVGNRAVARNVALRIDLAERRCRRPFAARGPAPPERDPLSGYLTSVSCEDHAWFSYLRWRTFDSLLLVSLGLQAYHAEHGGRPKRLDALVPGYLARVPEDPFAPGVPLRYRREGARYVLYSVGPDGRDDGGRPAQDTALRNQWVVEADSTGDVVSGVSR